MNMGRVDRVRGLLALLCGVALGCGDSADGDPDAGSAGSADGGERADAGETPPVPSGPMPAVLPEIQGSCPELVPGVVEFGDFHATIHVAEDAAKKLGPLVFYWHGTSSVPGEALVGLGQDVIDQVLAAGGLVAAMDGGQGTGFVTGPFEWRADDFDFADQVLACAIDQVGIDTRHIHSIGMSAGGLQTSNMAYWRANYIASVVAYSGGGGGLRAADDYPDNRFAALLFHGGPDDIIANLHFQMNTEKMVEDLVSHGHFAVMCNHGMNHSIPPGGGVAAWRFFRDHPYGTESSPYVADGLPDELPDYCEIQSL